jgi:large subunit ribosomal protein L31e
MSKTEDINPDDIIEERIYTVSFSKPVYGRGIPRTRRAPRAARHLRETIARHMKVSKVIIDPEVSEKLWAQGIQKPPRRIRVRVIMLKEDEVEVFLA